jgi:tetratricopeptide (TPR) repeat protein
VKAALVASPLAVLTLALGVGCRRPASQSAQQSRPAGASSTPVDQARRLLASGDADGALALVAQSSDPESLCLQGAAWTKKAELAPLPTPPPAEPGTRGGPPPAPEFKPEELKAVEAFERVLEGQPGSGCANLGLADLLAPHALRLHAAQAQASRRRRAAPPAAMQEGGPDYRPERVLQAYRAAVQADMAAAEPVERMVAFALQVDSLDDADQGLQELLRREREKPEPLVRYGDFLLTQKKNSLGAIEQYRQALIWRPDDPATKAKIADIYIGQAIDAYSKNQYAVADARLRDAQKYVTDPVSPQGLKIRDYMGKLNAIRQPAPR